jgi:hypothetical protein
LTIVNGLARPSFFSKEAMMAMKYDPRNKKAAALVQAGLMEAPPPESMKEPEPPKKSEPPKEPEKK